MRLEKVKEALRQKNVTWSYTEEEGLGSLDFLWRGLPYRVWEYREGDILGAETNVFETGRSRDIEGDYETVIAREILTWPDA